MAVLLKDGRIEYRFDVGNGLQTLRSFSEIKAGESVTVVAVRIPSQAELVVKPERQKPETSKTYVFSSGKNFNFMTTLFVGGYDEYDRLTDAVGVSQGFRGCVTFVSF